MTIKPIVTSNSVIAFKCTDGIIMGTDDILCYGSWKRFRDMDKVFELDDTVIMYTGEYSDFQNLQENLTKLSNQRKCSNYHKLSPKNYWSYINKLQYQMRMKMNYLYGSLIVAGLNNKENYQTDISEDKKDDYFLGYTDLRGLKYEDEILCTGFSSYFAIPILRERQPHLNMSVAEGKELIKELFAIVAGRECAASQNIIITSIKRNQQSGALQTIVDKETVSANFDHKAFKHQYDPIATTW